MNTGYTDRTSTDANGNQHLQAGSFTTTTGQSRAMDDIWFAVDTARTVDTDLVAVNSAIEALPDLAGFGNVHSLRQAMARDGSGKLQALVQQYTSTSQPTERAALLNDLIYRWAGVQDIDPASRAATAEITQKQSVAGSLRSNQVTTWMMRRPFTVSVNSTESIYG